MLSGWTQHEVLPQLNTCSTLKQHYWLFFHLLLVSSGRVGMVTVLQSVVRTERLLGLWKGVSPVRTSLYWLYNYSAPLPPPFPHLTLLCHPSLVLCAHHPWCGDLLQHLLLSQAALLPGQKPRGLGGRSTGSRGPIGGGGRHAAGHCHQDTVWSKCRQMCVGCGTWSLLLGNRWNFLESRIYPFLLPQNCDVKIPCEISGCSLQMASSEVKNSSSDTIWRSFSARSKRRF